MLRPLAILLLLAAPTAAADLVPVPGSDVKFPASVTIAVADKPVALKLTGVGVRSRAIFKVYAIGSYLQDGVAHKGAQDLIDADSPKMFYLVMERGVSGKDFLEAIRTAIGKAHPGEFAAEFKTAGEAISDKEAAKGDHVSLTYLPGTGLRVNIVNKTDFTIKNPAFAKAVWEAYLGEHPVDEKLKSGLVGK